MTYYLYVGNHKSGGARRLAEGLGIQRIRHKNSQFVGGMDKTVINWGAIEMIPETFRCKILNLPDVVRVTSDKLSFFQLMEGHCRIPEWGTSRLIAEQWIADGYKVVERHSLRGHSGAGIRIVSDERALEEAPLYTRYQSKADEYRIHLFSFEEDQAGGEIFDMQQKKRRHEFENPNWQVRNHKNGFIYAREDLDVPVDVQHQAIKCFNRTGLDFGAVDVIWNVEHSKAYVLEINTAPGVRGTTLKNYLKIFCND